MESHIRKVHLQYLHHLSELFGAVCLFWEIIVKPIILTLKYIFFVSYSFEACPQLYWEQRPANHLDCGNISFRTSENRYLQITWIVGIHLSEPNHAEHFLHSFPFSVSPPPPPPPPPHLLPPYSLQFFGFLSFEFFQAAKLVGLLLLEAGNFFLQLIHPLRSVNRATELSARLRKWLGPFTPNLHRLMKVTTMIVSIQQCSPLSCTHCAFVPCDSKW